MNSVKYGALSKTEGAVTVSSAVSDNRLRLEWRQCGGPPVQAPLKRGFGMNLIKQTVKGEGGRSHMIVEVDGLRWEITLPLNGGWAGAFRKPQVQAKQALPGPRSTAAPQAAHPTP
jgi:two-component sensor histidine kinase